METTALHQAVTAESTNTRTLLADLLVTIDDLRSQREYVAEDQAVQAAVAEHADAEITRIEREDLNPLQDEVAEVMATRSRLENELGLHPRIEELKDVGAQLVSEEAQPGGQPSRGIPPATLTGCATACPSTFTGSCSASSAAKPSSWRTPTRPTGWTSVSRCCVRPASSSTRS